jgi:hypothetical protein
LAVRGCARVECGIKLGRETVFWWDKAMDVWLLHHHPRTPIFLGETMVLGNTNSKFPIGQQLVSPIDQEE